MSGGGGGKNISQSTEVKLPDWYNPTAQGAIGAATQLAQMPKQEYGGPRIAPFTPEQELALQGTTNRALAGSPTIGPAEQMTADTLRGNYLNLGTNPAWQSMSQDLADAYKYGTAAQTDTAFSRANAFGDNSAYQQTVGRNQEAFGNALGNLAGDIYGRERGYQMQAAGLAPGLSEAGYGDYRALAGVGDVRRGYMQDVANMDYEDFLNAQNYGWNQLGMLGNTANTFLGNQGTTTQTGPNPYQANPIAGALGGASAGYSLGSMAGTALGSAYAPWLGLALGALGGYATSR